MRQRHHRVKLERGNELGQHFRRLTSIKITDFRLIPVTGVGNRQDSDNTRTNYKKTGRTDRPGQDKRGQNPNCRAANGKWREVLVGLCRQACIKECKGSPRGCGKRKDPECANRKTGGPGRGTREDALALFGISSKPWSWRQCFWASRSSLKTMVRVAIWEPGPGV